MRQEKARVLTDDQLRIRIRKHYLGLKKNIDPSRGSLGVDVWPVLAEHWKKPVQEIKRIVGYKQETDDKGEYYLRCQFCKQRNETVQRQVCGFDLELNNPPYEEETVCSKCEYEHCLEI